VCSNVDIEPMATFQPLDNEALHYATANRGDGAQFDVVARDFWGLNKQRAFLKLGCSTHLQVLIHLCPSIMLPTSKKRGMLMMRGGKKLKRHVWYFLPVIAWVHLLPLSIRSWFPC